MSTTFWWYFLLFGGTITLVIAHHGHEHHDSHASDGDDEDENANEDEDVDADENESDSDEENSICYQYHELLKIYEDNVEISECTPVKIQTSPKVIDNVRQWQLTIEGNSTTTLNLYKTEGLADNDTEIWIGNNPSRKHDKTTYIRKKIHQAAPNLGNFFMYQDRFKKAAIIVFTNGNDVLMEGFIGQRVLRRLSNKEYVLLRVTFPLDDFEEIQNTGVSLENQSIKSYDLKSQRGNTYLRVLVALDANSIGKKSTTETIKCVLLYYNAVDMMFSYFTSPTIHLKLSGIVIPENDNSMPYFRNVFHDHGHLEPAIKKVVKYFSKPRKNFISPKSYEFVTGMTVLPLCGNMDTCEEYGAVRYKYVNNSVENEVMFVGGIVRHPDFHGLYYVTVWQIANGLRIHIKMQNKSCPGLTNALVRPDSWSLDWSQCSLTEMTEFFRSKESDFLYRTMSYSESDSIVTTTQTVTIYEEIVEYEIVELVWTQTITTTVTRWTLTINTKNSSIVLHLHYAGKTLFNGGTYVWIGRDKNDGLNNTVYSKHTLSKITRDEFEDFRMYHDRDKKAAITVFFTKNGLQMAGFVGNYVLRQVSENPTRYTLVKTTFPREKHTTMNSVVHDATNSYNLHSQRKTVYPRILAVLDWSSVKGKSRAEVVKNTIVYYNAVDMMFSNFTWPKIKFMVTGIVIPQSQLVSYQSQGFHNNQVNLHEAPKGLAVYWQADGYKLIKHSHADFVTVMTNLPICVDKRTCNFYETYPLRRVTDNQGRTIALGLVRHIGFQGAYGATVKSLTKGLLRFRETAIKACPDFVDPNVEAYKWPLQWSQCSVNQLELFFLSDETQNWFTLQYTSTVTQQTVQQKSWESEEMQSDQAYQVTETKESTEGSQWQPVNYVTSYKTTETSTTVDDEQHSASDKSNKYGTTKNSAKSKYVKMSRPVNTATTTTTTTTVTTAETSHPEEFTNKTRKVTTMTSGSTRPVAKTNAHSTVVVEQQQAGNDKSEQYRTGNNVESKHVKNGRQNSTTRKTTVTTTTTKISHPVQTTKTVTTKEIGSAMPVVRRNTSRTVVSEQYRPLYNNKSEKYSLEKINKENVDSESLKSTTMTKTTVTTTTTKSYPGKSTATKTIATKEENSATPVAGINKSTIVADQQQTAYKKPEKYRTGETEKVEEIQNIPLNSKSTTKTTVTTTTTQSEDSYPGKSTVTKKITTKKQDSATPVVKTNTSATVVGKPLRPYSKLEQYKSEEIEEENVGSESLKGITTTTTTTVTTKKSHPGKSTVTKTITTNEQDSTMPVVVKNTSRTVVNKQYGPYKNNNKLEKYKTETINEGVVNKPVSSTTTKTTVTTTTTKTSHPGKSTVTKTITTKKLDSRMPDVTNKNTSTVVVDKKKTAYNKSEKYRMGETVRVQNAQNIPQNIKSTTKTTVTTTTTKSSYPGKSSATKTITRIEQGSAMPVVIKNTSKTVVGEQYGPYEKNNKSEKYRTETINESVVNKPVSRATTTTKTTVTTTTTKTSHPEKSTITKTITIKDLDSKTPDTSTVVVGQQQTGKSEKYRTGETVRTQHTQNIPLNSKSTTKTTVTTTTNKSFYPGKSSAIKTITRSEQGSAMPVVIKNTSKTVVGEQYGPYENNNKSEKYRTETINESVVNKPVSRATTTTKTTVTTTTAKTSHPEKSTITKTITIKDLDSKTPDTSTVVVGQQQTGKSEKYRTGETVRTQHTQNIPLNSKSTTKTTVTTTTNKSFYPGKSSAIKTITRSEQGSAMPVVIKNTSKTVVGEQYGPYKNNNKSKKYRTETINESVVNKPVSRATTTTKTTVTTTTTKTSHPEKSTITKTITIKDLDSKTPDTSTVVVGQQQTGKSEKYRTGETVRTQHTQNIPLNSKSTTKTTVTTTTNKSFYPGKSSAIKTITRSEQGSAMPVVIKNTSKTVVGEQYGPYKNNNKSEKYRTETINESVVNKPVSRATTTTKTTVTTTTTKTSHPSKSTVTKTITTKKLDSKMPEVMINNPSTIVVDQQKTAYKKPEKYRTGETEKVEETQNIPLNSKSTTKTTVTTTTQSSYPRKSTVTKTVTTKELNAATPVVETNTNAPVAGNKFKPHHMSEKYSTKEMKEENIASESPKSTSATTTKTTVRTTTTKIHPGKSTVTKTITKKQLASDATPILTANTSTIVNKQNRLFNNSEKYRTTDVVEAFVKDQLLNNKITTTTTTTTTTTKTLHPAESKTTKIITIKKSNSTKPYVKANEKNTIVDSQQHNLQNKSEKYKQTLTTASTEILQEKNNDMWEMQSDQGYEQTVIGTSTEEKPSRKYYSTNSVISEENRHYQPQEITGSDKFITEERKHSQIEKHRTGGVVQTENGNSITTVSKISASDRGNKIVSREQIASARVPDPRKSVVDEQLWPIETRTEKHVSSEPINRTTTTTTAKYFYPVGNGVKTSVITEVMGLENPKIIHPVVSSITTSRKMGNNDKQGIHQSEDSSVFRSENMRVKTVKNISLSTITNTELSTFLSTLILEQFSNQSQSTLGKFQRFSLVLVPEDETSGAEFSNNFDDKLHFVPMAVHIDKLLLVNNRKDFSKNEASECPEGCCKCIDER